MIKKAFTIPESFQNMRLDQALAQLMPEFSRMQIKDWITEGNLLVNDKSAKPSLKLRSGEAINLIAEIKPVIHNEPEPIPLDIVYEDSALLIINKPIGMVVHPGAGNRKTTLLNAILHHHPEANLLPRAGILHRLDKNTSGLLIIAKTEKALKSLSAQLKARTISREYQTIVYGKMISGGTVNQPIDRHRLDRKKMTVVSEGGKTAITHYRVLNKFRAHTHLLVRLETGRTHQIRVHMSHIRHPIIGDIAYGGNTRLSKNMQPEIIDLIRACKYQLLHAYAVSFLHPETEVLIKFEIDLPEKIKTLLQALQKDSELNK